MGQGFSRMLQTVSPEMTLPSTQNTPHKLHKFLLNPKNLKENNINEIIKYTTIFFLIKLNQLIFYSK